MTKPIEEESKTSSHIVPPLPPIYPHDNSSKIEIKLDGSNYSLWSKFVEIFVAGKDKYGFLTGESVKPATTSSTYRRWLADNALMQGWLLGSMTPKIMGMFIRLPTAQAIWEAVARTYYDGVDQSIIYELNSKAFHMRQSGRLISEYYGELNTIWQELDHRCPNDMTDATDVVRLNDRIEKQRVYMFLAGLDPEFDKVRADVLRMDPFPSVEGAFAYVRREVQRQATMLAPPQVSDSSALLINKGNSGDRKCTHCGQKNHIRDACWRLNGYPEWYLEKRKKGLSKNGTASLASSFGNSSSTPQGNICDSQNQFSNSGIFHSAFSGENPNYEEKSPKTDIVIPISLRSQSSEEENLSSESEIPDSLIEKTEPTLRVYERRNKGKEKQGGSVLRQVVQPSSSPSPVRQSDSEVENAPEVTLEPLTLSNDLSSENHTDPDPSLSTRRYLS
ncbi:hypothetical protein LWI29_017030 [Acer saccharum]|uniref:Retrotransposon Copia-like N-terminal domain-containing protein n=1 Tax=Acer saccharum TaxID=4024 RepID=A0AA39VC78_ACESA|nr:hypothetical protein LWI29_017030 [Acer saccharum]